jgi:hypothetical protein
MPKVNSHVDDWIEQQKKFNKTHGDDPCLGHAKMRFDYFEYNYSKEDDTLTKSHARKIMKKLILKLGSLAFFQSYQFKFRCNLDIEQ